MNISYNWLKQFVKLPDSVTAEEVAIKLTHSTAEVEGVRRQGELLNNVVVGKVVKAEKHPNADKLKLCQVDVGGEMVQIVCGGSNVAEGMLVALARVGAKVLWHGEGEPVELAPTAIRGIESFGMICGAEEIGLAAMFPPKGEKEIVDLTQYNYIPGTPLAVALHLDDAILEIDNKSLSHRPDLMGHYGIAREVAVLYNKDLAPYTPAEISKPKKGDWNIKVKVMDTKLCPRYMAVGISNVKVGPSPDWLVAKLSAVGVGAINNIVDITNYVMLEYGQPMHAFDAALIEEGKEKNIVVRLAKAGEKILALDKKEYNLTEKDLVIANDTAPMAVAGIIGGEGSAITVGTTDIIFESANFLAASVRTTSSRLGVRTESAQRFEKSLDPNQCQLALQKAVALVLELCPEAMVVTKVVDEANFSLPVGPIEVSKNITEQLLGFIQPEKETLRILEKLGFEVKDKKTAWSVLIPTWRATKDIAIPEDIGEEILRLSGYGEAPAVLPLFPVSPVNEDRTMRLIKDAEQTLAGSLGFCEAHNYAFVSAETIKRFGDDISKYIELDNPLAKDRPYITRHLLPGLLDNVSSNLANEQIVKLFEIAKVFRADESGPRAEAGGDELLPRQDVYLEAVYADKKNSVPWNEGKRVLEQLFQKWGVVAEIKDPSTVVGGQARPWEHPGRLAIIVVNEKPVGVIREVAPQVSAKFGIDTRVASVCINLSALAVVAPTGVTAKYKPALAFPAVERDMAFLVPVTTTHESVVVALQDVDPLLQNIELFDTFSGKNIPAGKKSVAYRFIMAHNERTLTTEEVDKVMAKVTTILTKKLNAEMRK